MCGEEENGNGCFVTAQTVKQINTDVAHRTTLKLKKLTT